MNREIFLVEYISDSNNTLFISLIPTWIHLSRSELYKIQSKQLYLDFGFIMRLENITYTFIILEK